ncbi:MAG: BamA/TamA family outer membrane protein [Firmicutes bacterium]|nr:BamA/TamA family outer membrane protein [Bacillota bacterium]
MKFLSRLRAGGGLVIIICLGIILAALPVLAETNPIVMLIEVQGNERIADELILGAVSNTKIGEPLNAKSVELDRSAIENLGYFLAVIARTEKALNGVKLIFEVIENPIYQGVKITGLTKINPDELLPFYTLKPGTVFNRQRFGEDHQKALKFCQDKKGYLVDSKTTKLDDDGFVRIELVELRYGRIIIQGMTRTKDFVVRRELSFKEGDIIDLNVLREDIGKIMRLRIFEYPDVQFQPSADIGMIDLVITLKEAVGVGEFNLGVSESQGEVSGLFGYKNPNLMGLGQDLSLDIQISKNKNNVQFSFTEPWLDANHTSFGLSMWNSETDMISTMNSWFPFPDFQTNNEPILYNMHFAKMGLGLQLGRPFGNNTHGVIKFNFEENNIKSYSGINLPTPTPTPPYPPSSEAEHPLHFWDNSAELQFYQNRLNYRDPFWVTGGYYLSANYYVSSKYLGGEYDYQKYGLEGKWFCEFTPNLVLGTRLRGNYLTGEYPDYYTYYLGGMNQLRGYYNDRFANSETRQLIGTQTLLSNTELRYRLPSNKNFEFVLFYDIGQVANNSLVSTTKYDYGIGFRYNIPFLALLGFDYTINAENKAEWVFKIGETF